MSRNNGHLREQMRSRIAQLAARMMAQDGIDDYALAKRKAARQLGADDTQNLPNNSEIEQALRDYHAIYQPDEQPARVRALREQALRVMRELAEFDPQLTGSVLSGTATRFSDINLVLVADDLKEVEIFLLNRNVPFKLGERRLLLGDGPRAVPVLTLTEAGPAEVGAMVLSPSELRRLPRGQDGRVPERARLPEVEQLLAANGA